MEIKNLKDNFKFYVSILALVLVSAGILSQSKAQEKKTSSYPRVVAYIGEVVINGQKAPMGRLTFKVPLRERAQFEVGSEGFVEVALDATRSFRVLKNSKVVLPVVNWESGQVPVVLLEKGELQWNQSGAGSYNIALRSGLFEFIVPEGDFVFAFDPAKAWAGVKVLKGQIVFSGLNAEDEVVVKEGFQGGFQGRIEEGQIAYDILLKGKKIAKGLLTPLTPIPAEELAAPAKSRAAAHKRQKDLEQKKQQALKQAQKGGAICKNPWGKFNECSYTCEGNPKGAKECLLEKGASCVRRRCNANGEWAEALKLDPQNNSTTCESSVRVGAC